MVEVTAFVIVDGGALVAGLACVVTIVSVGGVATGTSAVMPTAAVVTGVIVTGVVGAVVRGEGTTMGVVVAAAETRAVVVSETTVVTGVLAITEAAK